VVAKRGVERPEEWLELIEVTSQVKSFFSNGIRIIETAGSSEEDHPAAFACLAIGMEQLLKTTLGLIHASDNGRWPDRATFQAFGHNISRLDEEVRHHLRERRHHATYTAYVQSLADAVDADAVLPLMIDVLSQYGSSGRYVHLDALTDPATTSLRHLRATPLRIWYDDIEGALLHEDQSMLKAVMAGDREPLNRAAGVCLRRWYDYIGANWVHGVAGDRAKRFGLTLKLDA
jgi:hypothetical protein